MAEAKPFVIDKWAVHNAFLKVKENKGSGGIDGISIVRKETLHDPVQTMEPHEFRYILPQACETR